MIAPTAQTLLAERRVNVDGRAYVVRRYWRSVVTYRAFLDRDHAIAADMAGASSAGESAARRYNRCYRAIRLAFPEAAVGRQSHGLFYGSPQMFAAVLERVANRAGSCTAQSPLLDHPEVSNASNAAVTIEVLRPLVEALARRSPSELVAFTCDVAERVFECGGAFAHPDLGEVVLTARRAVDGNASVQAVTKARELANQIVRAIPNDASKAAAQAILCAHVYARGGDQVEPWVLATYAALCVVGYLADAARRQLQSAHEPLSWAQGRALEGLRRGGG